MIDDCANMFSLLTEYIEILCVEEAARGVCTTSVILCCKADQI